MRSVSCILASIFVFVLLVFPACCQAGQKRILYVASYHTEKGEWTAGIKSGIESVILARSDVIFKVHNMDTRLSKSDEEKRQAAMVARETIDSWKPDVVITSDDNAAKFLIEPYYKDAALPFVFCGLNWDASAYGLPYANTTGMVEVQLIRQIVEHLQPYARGMRIGTLRGDTLTNRKEQSHFEKELGVAMTSRYVTTLEEWKRAFLAIQQEVDLLVLGSIRALDTGNVPLSEIARFAMENTSIPTAAYDEFMNQLVLVTLSTIPEEQGEWAAEQALRILDGTAPADIPIVKNRKAKRFLNMRIAKKLSIRFPIELIESSHLVSAARGKVLFVNSYHQGYAWSDDIEKGLLKALDITLGADGSLDSSRSEVELRLFRMNSKLEDREEQIRQAALKAKGVIDSWQPDLVITSDDNAAKFLIQPYYLSSSLPFVFCGVNYDESVYNLPAPNVTGMVEVEHLGATIAMLKEYAQGERVGYLGFDDMSNRKSLGYHKTLLGIEYSDGSLVSTLQQWMREFDRLQEAVDMLIIINPIGIRGWDNDTVSDFLLEHTRIPTGAIGDSEVRYALLGNVKIAEEQGWWAGTTALSILHGTPVSAIGVTRNEKSRLIINMLIANRLGIQFPVELLERATMFSDEEPLN